MQSFLRRAACKPCLTSAILFVSLIPSLQGGGPPTQRKTRYVCPVPGCLSAIRSKPVSVCQALQQFPRGTVCCTLITSSTGQEGQDPWMMTHNKDFLSYARMYLLFATSPVTHNLGLQCGNTYPQYVKQWLTSWEGKPLEFNLYQYLFLREKQNVVYFLLLSKDSACHILSNLAFFLVHLKPKKGIKRCHVQSWVCSS